MQRGKSDPQREFVLGEAEKECGSWLRGCQDKGRKGRRGKKKESGHLWVEGYYRLIGLFMLLGCYSLPFHRFFVVVCFFFLLLVCFIFLICKVKSSFFFFFFPKENKESKEYWKRGRKEGDPFIPWFIHKAYSRKEGRKEVIWCWTWEHLLAVCLWRTYLTSLSKRCYPQQQNEIIIPNLSYGCKGKKRWSMLSGLYVVGAG